MFGLNGDLRFYLYNVTTDTRKSFDGLGGLIQNSTDYNLLCGDVYVFVNKKNKDIDARWTKKNGETFFGYKNHAKVDEKSKFIDNYKVTDASVHDSQPLDDLLTEDDSGQDFFADSAYTGEEQEKVIDKYEMNNKVHENNSSL